MPSASAANRADRVHIFSVVLYAVLCILGTPSVHAAADGARVVLMPESLHFGMIDQGEVVEAKLSVSNSSDRPILVRVISLCDCLSAQPLSRTVAPGGEGGFTLRYDSRDDTGIVRKNFLITTDAPGYERMYIELRGTVRAEHAAGEGQQEIKVGAPPRETPARGPLTIRYYFTPGCRSCETFLAEEIPRLEDDLGIVIDVMRRDILDPAVYDELATAVASLGQGIRAIPVLRVGDTFLQGDEEIESGLRSAMEVISQAAAEAPEAAARSAVPASLSVLAVAAAGLLDGINPCAFTTLVFLLSYLALAGRSRREVLVIGSLFTLAIFLTYLGIGLGLFAALRAASAMPLVSRILRWVLVASLIVFAGLNLYDYIVIRRGDPAKILLQLPSALKQKIHASIRTQARSAALAGGSLLLGFLVSIHEFTCTGQVYLPTLAYLARTSREASSVALLVLYNAAFVLPLLVVFTAGWFGVSSGRIAAFYRKRMGAVKLGLAVVFLGLAAFTLWSG